MIDHADYRNYNLTEEEYKELITPPERIEMKKYLGFSFKRGVYDYSFPVEYDFTKDYYTDREKEICVIYKTILLLMDSEKKLDGYFTRENINSVLSFYSLFEREFVRLKTNCRFMENRDYACHWLEKIREKIETLEKRKKYLKRIDDKKAAGTYDPSKDISLEEVKKQVKIKDILIGHGIKIERNNFFKIRNENTPSCQFNHDKNLWVDFGNANQGGSVIDLYMCINQCDLSTAVKKLKTLI